MKKFVFIPDSFKGTMSSSEICEIMTERAKEIFPEITTLSVPVADGGEGTVDCFLSAIGGEKVFVNTVDPYFNQMTSYYGILSNGVAVIETASTAGLPLVKDNKNPLKTTTFGLGEMFKDAIKKGVKEIILGLGGSCTNDFGCGLASSLGVKFYDCNGKEFVPVGGTLKDVCGIDVSNAEKLISGVKITAMCDVENTPFGENGASRVFAPQKGADENAVIILDEGVKHLCEIIKRDYNVDYSSLKGGGAAGALGAGVKAFLHAQLKMGIETVLDTVEFDKIISDADAVFTGEGKIDAQSLGGKAVIGIARRAKKQGVPVISIVGGIEGDLKQTYIEGVTAVFSINRLPEDFSVSKFKSKENLSNTMTDVYRLMKI